MTQEWRTRETDPLKRIVAELGELRGALTSITNGILTNAGLVVAKGLLRVLQSMRVEGDLDVTGTTELGGPTTISGNTGVTGSLSVTGPMTVGGTLSLPAGIIDNDALANPFTGVVEYATTSGGFGVTTTATDVLVASVTVPAGFTRALMTGMGSLFFLNPSPNVDYVYAHIYMDVGAAWARGHTLLSMAGPNNGSAALAPNRMKLFEGLSGGDVIYTRLRAYTGFVDLSSTSNSAGVAAQALFLR